MEMCADLAEALELRRISLVGIGTGAEDTFTIEGKRICQEADLLIGAKRMLQAVRKNGQPDFEEYRADQIVRYISDHPEYHDIAVALSGDPGFYSGAKRLKELMEQELVGRESDIDIRIIPGISSAIYLSAKLGVSWEDAVFASVHGRTANLVSLVRKNPKVFVLAGSAEDVRETGNTFAAYGYGDLKVGIGVDLSYDTEQVIEGKNERMYSL